MFAFLRVNSYDISMEISMENRRRNMVRDMAIAEIEEDLLTIEAFVNSIRDALSVIKATGEEGGYEDV
jgi:hypothetical protein